MLVRQILAFALAHMRAWWRRPIEAGISILLAVAFLMIANQAFTVWLGENVRLGLYTTEASTQQVLLLEFDRLGVRTTCYADEESGAKELREGKTSAFVSVQGFDPLRFRLVLGGRNPLLDRELSGQLLRTAERIIQREMPSMRVEIVNDKYTAAGVTAFITAGMIAFFILTLTHTNNGSFWVREWEHGTVHTLLSTPVLRVVPVVGRFLAGAVLTLLTLALALVMCRWVVHWPWPEHVLPWLGVIGIQIFMGSGVFFALAAVCRRYRFYVNISSFLVILLIFISGTVSPVEIMPAWERFLSQMTPTFYAVRSMRAVMLGTEPLLPGDLTVMIVWGILAHAIGYLRLVNTTIKA